MVSCNNRVSKGHNNPFSFYVNLPLGGAAVMALILFLHLPQRAAPSSIPFKELFVTIDPIGMVALFAALISLFLVLEWGGVTRLWNDAAVIGLIAAFCALVIIFIGLEIWQGERELLVSRLIRRGTMAVCATFIFL